MTIKLPDNPIPQSINKRRTWTSASAVAALLLVTAWFTYSSYSQDEPHFPSPPPPPFHRGKPSAVLSPTHENYNELTNPLSLENATAIFNTINAALRPKHSQILPNGVSFIPAYIPEGTLLYHGNEDGEVPDGLEWIAMDHEFSFSFISHRNGPRGNDTHGGPPHWGGPPGGPPGKGKPPGKGPDDKYGPPPNGPPPPHMKRGEVQPPPPHGEVEAGGIGPGGPKGKKGRNSNKDHASMLTFQVIKPLDKMILLDGSSGAKSSTGEMDTQMILAKVGVDKYMNEYEAAQRICKWGKPFGIDGFIRIEVAFEAVICNLKSDKLQVVSNVTLDWRQEALGLPLDPEDPESDDPIQELLREVGSVAGYDQIKQGNVHDKRDRRILLDYRGLVTPLNKTWISPDTYTRRINNISQDLQDELITDLFNYMSNEVNPYQGTDWQLVTDEIIDKFSPLLKQLNQSLEIITSDSNNEEILNAARNVTISASNFIQRFADHNIKDQEAKYSLAKKQAIYQYSHPLQPLQSESDVFIWSAITKITNEIISTIFEISKHTTRIIKAGYVEKISVEKYRNSLIASKEHLSTLLETLQWSVYYECERKCNWDEVCYTPSWGPNPLGWGGEGQFGTYKDAQGRQRIDTPLQCINAKTILERR